MKQEKLTHGLLTEDFKQSILHFINQHKLDIQTKSIILESICIHTQMTAKAQTEKELEEYKALLNADKTSDNAENSETEKAS